MQTSSVLSPIAVSDLVSVIGGQHDHDPPVAPPPDVSQRCDQQSKPPPPPASPHAEPPRQKPPGMPTAPAIPLHGFY